MAVPPGLSPGINPATSSPVSWNLPDFNFSDPLGGAKDVWSGGDLPLGISDIDVRLENTIGDPSVAYIGETALPPGSERDLASHYYVSQQLTDRFGKFPAAVGGAFQELLNRGAGGTVGSGVGGLSLDDLAANYAGIIGATPEQAARAGFFEHTEPLESWEGLGQGTISGNWDKIRALHSGSFPFIRNTFGGRIESEGPGVISSDPQQKSIWQRALARLMPGAQAASLTPEEGGYYGPGIEYDEPAQPMYPQVPLPAQPLYPTLTPDTPLRQHRQPHYPKWSLPGDLGVQDDFSGVQWRIPDPVIPPSEYDFSVAGFRAPPVPSAPSDIHVESGVPPQTPQVVGGDDGGDDDSQEEVRARNIARSVEKAVVPTKVIRANQKRAVSATKKALKAFEVHEEAKRSGSPAEISRTNRARVQAAIERKEADARNRSTQRYDPFAFEDRRGGRR